MVGYMPPYYTTLYHPGYTTILTVHADHAGLLTTVGCSGALGSREEKPLGGERERALKS